MLHFFLFLFLITIGYLCGSISSAVLVSKIFSLPDPRKEGSNNPGATNVLRLSGKKYAALVLVYDMLKGFFPVLLGQFLHASPAILGFTCLAAVLGHVYPLFFNFEGGKGVATALGAFLGLHFLMGSTLIAIWFLVANFSRYSSLASIITMIIAPFAAIYVDRGLSTFIPLLLISLLILYKHRKNINQLMEGKEPKISLKHHQLSDITDSLIKNQAREEGYDHPHDHSHDHHNSKSKD
jgi:glycerol-3-phosphate acyltransferase PlsY